MDTKNDQHIPEHKDVTKVDDTRRPAIQTIRLAFRWIYTHKIGLGIATATIALIITIVILLPVLSVGNLALVNTGASVKLESGQTARLKIADVSVKIVHFTNQTCAQPGKCFGTDTKAVEYELNVNGTKYSTGSASNANTSEYQIVTMSSDYKTYSILKIIKSN